MEEQNKTNNNVNKEQAKVTTKDVEKKVTVIKGVEKFSQGNVNHLKVIDKLVKKQGEKKND